jgi:hypothetical protein
MHYVEGEARGLNRSKLTSVTACQSSTFDGEESLQFTSDGYVLLFATGSVTAASASHTLKMEFIGANRVEPVTDGMSINVDAGCGAAPLTK